MQSEDFPALPGAATASSNGAGSAQQDAGGDGFFRHGVMDAGGLGKVFASSANSGGVLSRSTDDLSVALGGSGGSRADRYGLMGILAVIRMTEPDLNTLALGTDLTSLGLNLNSSDCLYATFASPWADSPVQREPEFTLPQCYYMQPPALKTGHFSKFQLETLFYIFYNMPRDTLQAYAATELYNRDWRYHKDLTLWFTRATRQGADDGQKGQYIYFDITEWRKKLFHGVGGASGPVGGGEDAEEMSSLGE
jgi:CCR4-NOT transcription complex subunit 2